MDHFTRRAILRVGAVGAAGAAAWNTGLFQRTPAYTRGELFGPNGPFGGYGDLVEDPDGQLDLPEGFTYRILAASGDRMADGRRPERPDGMEYFDIGGGQFALCLNHEITDHEESAALLTPGTTLPGGCTTLILNDDLSVAEQFVSHRDTSKNCAGGKSPWGTWLTCEEHYIAGDPGEGGAGFVHDVDPFTGENGRAYPAMGQFQHEAVAFDPETGIVYLTEDEGDGLFYRFIPDTVDDLTRGRLQAMAVQAPDGDSGRLGVDWIPVSDYAREQDLRAIGAELGATPFKSCEGITHVRGSIYFDEGAGGDAGLGRIWRYQPATDVLELFYESTDEPQLNRPDNMRDQPGTEDLIYCEDGKGDEANRLVVQNSTGKLFTFAQDRTDSEFAGACWSPDGRRLFVNVQQAGFTYVIEGPFRQALAAEYQRTNAHLAPTGGRRRADGDQVARAARDRGMSALEVEAALALGFGHLL